MSTRSHIAIEDKKDKKIHSIYVHSDGYPNGVGHCLLTHYNRYEKAKDLFQFGNASSLGSTLKECSFYERDWGRNEEKAQRHNNEWCYVNSLNGDIFIEYIYLFKNGRWYISTQKSIDKKELPHDMYEKHANYLSVFCAIEEHEDYKPEEIDTDRPTEKEMIATIGPMLNKMFKPENVMVQGHKKRKMN